MRYAQSIWGTWRDSGPRRHSAARARSVSHGSQQVTLCSRAVDQWRRMICVPFARNVIDEAVTQRFPGSKEPIAGKVLHDAVVRLAGVLRHQSIRPLLEIE